MTKLSSTRLFLLTLTILGVASHLAPHDMGVSTIGAVSMLAAAYLPRHLLLIPVLATVMIGDMINGGYAYLGMLIVYSAHLISAMVLMPFLTKISTLSVVGAAILNAVFFYLISNVTPMAMDFYPATIDGWLLCYVNGLPFLLKGILANIVFGGIAFGFIHLLELNRENRITASQRN